MKQFFHKIIVSLSLLLAVALPVATPTLAYAQGNPTASKDAVCQGLGGCNGGGTDINRILKVVLNIFSAIVGFIAVIMIIVGGLKYITSQGDSNNVNNAKNTILYAVIGLVVVTLAQVIVKFVLDRAT